MKLSRVGLMFVMVVILSFGWQAKPSEAFPDTCRRPDVLFSYLDIDRYNKSYPYVDYKAVVKPALDHMLGRASGVSDSYADIVMYWVQVCNAEDPEKEIAAWKTLAYDLNQRMFTDEAVYRIINKLFGDKMVGLLMSRPNLFIPRDPDDSDMPCLDRVSEIFVQHCGLVSSYYSMKFINTPSIHIHSPPFFFNPFKSTLPLS